MPRPLRVLLTGLAYSIFGIGGIVLGFSFLPVAWLRHRDPERRRVWAKAFLGRWAGLFVKYMRWTRLITFEPPAVPPVLARGEPAVVIANHPSLIDVLFLLGSVPGLTVIAKPSWFRKPLLGSLLRQCGHVCAPDGSPADGAIALERILAALNEGSAVLIFPEGTRSPVGELGRFQRGSFEAAMRARVPLVCLAISVDPPFLRKDQHWYDVPDRRIEWKLWTLAIVDPEDHPSSARIFCRQTREAYLNALISKTAPPLDDAPARASSGAP